MHHYSRHNTRNLMPHLIIFLALLTLLIFLFIFGLSKLYVMVFEPGHKYSEVYNLENALPRFEDALKFATENEDCLCLQDAKYKTAIPSRTFDHLVDTHDILRSIKQDIMEQIVRRVNRLAMKDQAPAAPAIWRMKQLGEKDQQFIDQSLRLSDSRKTLNDLFPSDEEIDKS